MLAPPSRASGSDPVVLGLVLVAAITLLRLWGLWLSDTDLFFDEAQYWIWGQNLDFGYYSKPPLIGWVIRAVTDLAGSDSPFWVRAAAPVFHGAAALALIALARRLMDGRAALLVGLAYLSLPMIALGSLLISTDTILLPFWCAALLLWARLAEAPRLGEAVLLGLCLGLGVMAKYAGLYFVIGAVLTQIFLPTYRVKPALLLVAAVTCALVIAPNVIWNQTHDFATLSHTADNVDWVKEPGGPSLHPGKLAEFLLSQAGVMGPVLFGAYLWAVYVSLRRGTATERWLLCMSLPVLLLVCVQAFLSKAYANWAAMTYPAAIVLVVLLLANRARWLLWVGVGINLALSLALSGIATQATTLRRGDDLLLARYAGRVEMAQAAVAVAQEAGGLAIVADDRQLLADLFYGARGAGLAFYAVPHSGKSPHYYADQFPLDAAAPAELMFLGDTAPCAEATLIAPLALGDGAYKGRSLAGYRVPKSCWLSPSQ